MTALILLVLGAATPVLVAAQAPVPAARPARVSNPVALSASEQLSRRAPGEAARVLFQWDQVPGAREYVLQGRWVDRATWALRSGEYRVGATNARQWTAELVTFDVSLPPGTHSWTVVAVFGAQNVGDFAHPTHVAFDLGGPGD